jgi:hypothetical protein
VSAAPATARRPNYRLRRLSLLGGVILIVAAAVILISGSGEAAPDLSASSIVPGDALVFVSLSTDPGRPAVESSLATAQRFPGYPVVRAALLGRLAGVIGGGARGALASGFPSWVGKEAAIAVLDTPSATAGSLVALQVADRSQATAFLTRVGISSAGSYRGTPLLRSRSGAELAFVGSFLALGQDASVRAAVDVVAGRSSALASTPAYRNAASGEPDDAVVDAYASVGGVRRVLSAGGGAPGALGRLLDQPALQGVGISVSPRASGAAIRVHSTLDPTLQRVSGSRPRPFVPSLAGALPSGTTLMLDVGDLSATAPRILAAAGAAGFGGGLAPLLGRLGNALGSEGVDIRSVLADIFGGETAVAIVPRTTSPTLVLVARAPNQDRVRAQLAALELPLSQLFPAPTSGPGGTPTFNDVPVGAITAHELALNPGLQLDYAVFHHLVVISTSLQGIQAIARHRGSLANDPAYRAEIGAGPGSVTSLLFLDFSQLLSLGEQTGLTGRQRIQALFPDLQRVRAVGLSSTSGKSDSTAVLSLTLS